MQQHITMFRRLTALALVGLVTLAYGRSAAAQMGQAPDFTQFGFPQVVATVDFTPGQATRLEANGQRIDIPADFLTNPARFELLGGEASVFAPYVQGQQVVAPFAFRVTDTVTHQRVNTFNTPVQWQLTSAEVQPDSAVFDTTPTSPPTVVPNSVSPGSVTGSTITHPFKIASVGWVILNPATAAPTLPTTGALDVLSTTSLALIGTALLLLAGMGAWLHWGRRRTSPEVIHPHRGGPRP